MQCEQVMPFLEEYLDGEIEASRAALIEAHLPGCARCGEAFGALRREQEIYSRYDRELNVTHELWDRIQQRIAGSNAIRDRTSIGAWLASLFRTPRLSPGFAILIVVVAIGVTALVLRYAQRNPTQEIIRTNEPTETPNQIPVPPERGPDTASVGHAADSASPVAVSNPGPKVRRRTPRPEELIREAEAKYLSAISILSRDVDRRRTEFDPALLARFDSAIQEIDNTIAETKRAARDQRDDPTAQQYVLAAYSRKVDLLRDMAGYQGNR
jgi:hypothetical protein